MGIMLVYDITNEKTFENIVKWLRNIDEVSIKLIIYIHKYYLKQTIIFSINIFESMQMKMWKR